MSNKKMPLQTFGMSGTKWEFFTAAVDLFFAKGYSNVTIRDIADVLKVKPASMYYYFLNKDALLQQMYDYCEAYYATAAPQFEELLDSVPNTLPSETFEKLIKIFEFGGETGEMVGKISHIALEEKARDDRAEKLAKKVFIEMPGHYIKTILKRMLELDMIEPVDADLFTHLYSGFLIGSACCFGSKLLVSHTNWRKSCSHMFNTVNSKVVLKKKEKQ